MKTVSEYPNLMEEWSEKNNQLPNEVSFKSLVRIIWNCVKGHGEWTTSVKNRTIAKSGCPYCSGRRAILGVNDLSTIHPHLAEEWDDDRDILTIKANSNIKAKWKCRKHPNHKWEAIVHSRATGRNCPYCSNKKVLEGYNDLATTHPYLSEEWSPENRKTAKEVYASGNRIGEWVCRVCKGKWRSMLSNRSRHLQGCPYCAGKKPIPGRTDLFTLFPELLNEWNDPRKMSKFTQGSKKLVQLRCLKDKRHGSYKVSVYDRVKNNIRCYYCSGKRVLKGVNSVSATHPHLVDEWYKENEKSTEEVTAGSGYRAIWECKKNHKWSTKVSSRTREKNPTSCPECHHTSFSSRAELELNQFVQSLGFSTVKDQKILKGRHLDIYIPSKNIAFEFNGDYWHSNDMSMRSKGVTSREYHRSKVVDSLKEGVHLYFVWEDDWRDRKEEVQSEIEKLLSGEVTKSNLLSRLTSNVH